MNKIILFGGKAKQSTQDAVALPKADRLAQPTAPDDVASRLALLQADVEHLLEQAKKDQAARAELGARIDSLAEQVDAVRSQALSIQQQASEAKLSSEQSAALISALQPEKLVVELSKLSIGVSELKGALLRHESEQVKKTLV